MGGVFSATQFETAMDIPGNYFKEKKEIYSVVEKISDGDTYKVRHITKPGQAPKPYKGPMKEHTIIVRVAAVDCPETAKQGNPGQPFSQEAKEFATEKLMGKEVRVKLLSRDQYGRVVGLVKYKDTSSAGFMGSLFGGGGKERDISEELLKNGLAVVYRQGGAQYDGSISRWNDIESDAKKAKKGLWAKGEANVQLPSDYKKAVNEKKFKGTKTPAQARSTAKANAL